MSKRADADDPTTLPSDDPFIGQSFGEFTIEELIGRGGMGVVYRARQASLDREVAIKILHPSFTSDTTLTKRFRREARSLAALNHPNVVQVYARGQDRGYQYIAMELVPGVGLDRVLNEETGLPVGRIVDIMRQVAAALAACHAKGIMHRDVKPSNILVTTDGRVKITDFGIAKREGVDEAVTIPGIAPCTVEYASPEVARGEEAEPASDLYSLGATFYRVIAGQPPFTGPNPMTILTKHVQDPVPPLAEAAPGTPSALCGIIHRLLAKKPAQRYRSAADLLAALDLVAPPPPAVAPQSATAPNTRWPTEVLAVHGEWQVYTSWPFDTAEAKRRQLETAQALRVDVEQQIDLGKGVNMALVLIPAGGFLMGSPPTTSPEKLAKAYGGEPGFYENEFPQHQVRLTRPFLLGKLPVTQAQWHAVLGDNPSAFQGNPQNPVERVNWERCQDFLLALSARLGKTFRLPTEAEWEYACRAGSTTEFCFGDDAGNLDAYAWFGAHWGSSHPVGQKQPNAWGLHDMHGNVWEWCQDRYGAYKEGDQSDPTGPEAGEGRVVRGGSWNGDPGDLRSAARAGGRPGGRGDSRGFRLVLAPGP